jgi:hypothetical protein
VCLEAVWGLEVRGLTRLLPLEPEGGAIVEEGVGREDADFGRRTVLLGKLLLERFEVKDIIHVHVRPLEVSGVRGAG